MEETTNESTVEVAKKKRGRPQTGSAKTAKLRMRAMRLRKKEAEATEAERQAAIAKRQEERQNRWADNLAKLNSEEHKALMEERFAREYFEYISKRSWREVEQDAKEGEGLFENDDPANAWMTLYDLQTDCSYSRSEEIWDTYGIETAIPSLSGLAEHFLLWVLEQLEKHVPINFGWYVVDSALVWNNSAWTLDAKDPDSQKWRPSFQFERRLREWAASQHPEKFAPKPRYDGSQKTMPKIPPGGFAFYDYSDASLAARIAALRADVIQRSGDIRDEGCHFDANGVWANPKCLRVPEIDRSIVQKRKDGDVYSLIADSEAGSPAVLEPIEENEGSDESEVQVEER